MQNAHGKDLLRAQVSSSWLYRIFNIVFVVLFAVAVLLAIFGNPDVLYAHNIIMLVVAAVAGSAVIFLISRLFSLIPRLKPTAERIIVIVLLVLLFGIQLYIGRALLFEMAPSSDSGMVFSAAEDFVQGGPYSGAIFKTYPRNAGLYVLWCALFSVFRLFGAASFAFPAMVFNASAITASVFLLYLCVRRMFGPGKSLFVLVGSFFMMPFIAGAALPCAETVLLPIPIAAVMMWLRARSFWRRGEVKSAVIRTCIASGLLGVGALFKMSVLVVWVAIAIDLLVLLCGKGRLRLLLASFFSIAVIFFAFNFLFWISPLLPAYSGSDRMPETAYVLSGLAEPGEGGGDYESLQGIGDSAQRATQASEDLRAKFSEMGFGGFVFHLMDKLAYLFGDGSYGLAGAYNQAEPSAVKGLFAATGANFGIIVYVLFAMEMGVLVWMVVGAVKSLFRGNDAFTFLRVALFGLTLFMLFWDASPRWLVSLLPLMILCALEAAPVPAVKPVRDVWQALPEEEAPLDGLTEEERKDLAHTAQWDNDAPGDRPDYMDPSFGLVRDEAAPRRESASVREAARTPQPQVYHKAVPAAQTAAKPKPMDKSNSFGFKDDAPPSKPPQAGSIWDFMEDD